MKLIISVIPDSITPSSINKMILIIDTGNGKINYLNFNKEIDDVVKATGLCYCGDWVYGGLICNSYRNKSYLWSYNLKTKESFINQLMFTKNIHSLEIFYQSKTFHILFANSTQNDSISTITIKKGKVIDEDLFYKFTNSKRDDSIHNNCIRKFKNEYYVSMFLDFNYRIIRNEESWRDYDDERRIGVIYNITRNELIRQDLAQPHTIYFDSNQNLLFCESAKFRVFRITTNDKINFVELDGYARGICEDKEKGGYWIGISNHRHLCSKVRNAKLQFIKYDFTPTNDVIEIKPKEIFDILPWEE